MKARTIVRLIVGFCIVAASLAPLRHGGAGAATFPHDPVVWREGRSGAVSTSQRTVSTPTAPYVVRAGDAGAPGAVIAVLGDSVAFGAYDTVRGGWVTRLERTLRLDYPGSRLRILNAAGNGGTTAALPHALAWVREQATPALVIIAYGLNDFDEHVPLAAMTADLQAALQTLQSWPTPPAVILMGMPPITALSPARLAAERAYTDAMRRVAAAGHAGYLDEFDLWLALGPRYLHTLRHDTEHPNPAGYAFTAATVAAFLQGAYLDRRGHVHPPQDPPSCSVAVCGP